MSEYGDTQKYVEELVQNPREALNIEIKDWLDPSTDEGQSKIVKAAIALYNQNGGFLLIGFSDTEPSNRNKPADPRNVFILDNIQGIISKRTSKPFEIELYFANRDGIDYPIIKIPTGVQTPIACKADLKNGEIFLLKENEIYVRTLRANNIVSSAKASCKDLDDLVARCFENREADVSRFFAKLLKNFNAKDCDTLTQSLVGISQKIKTDANSAQDFLSIGGHRFNEEWGKRHKSSPPFGMWEVATSITGSIKKYSVTDSFYSLLITANPNLTGWPVWLDARSFKEEQNRPHVMDNRWETFLHFDNADFVRLDFSLLDPIGLFYLRRSFQDDCRIAKYGSSIEKELDPVLMTLRVAETIAVGLAFGKQLVENTETAELNIAFRWMDLHDRKLSYWSKPASFPPIRERNCKQDEILSKIALPMTANEDTIANTTYNVISPLMNGFDGYDPGLPFVQNWVHKLLSRTL